MKSKRYISSLIVVVVLLLAVTFPVAAQTGTDPAPIVIDWGRIITEILLTFVIMALPGALIWVYSHAASAWKAFKTKQPNMAYVLECAALIAVKGAEELNVFGDLKDKKTWAIDYAQKYLEAHGIKNLDVAVIEGAIEAAVLDTFNKSKLPEAQTKSITFLGTVDTAEAPKLSPPVGRL